jgi:predicted ArsR family transcriptional regulator
MVYVSGVSGALTPSLAVVRLLQGFSGKSVPIDFVASQVGLEESALRRHLKELEEKNVVKLDGDKVSIAE